MKNSLTHQYSGFGRLRTVLVLAGVVSLFFTSVSIAAYLQPKALEYSKTHQLQQSQSLDGKGTIITSVCRSKTYIKDDPQNDYLWNLDHNCFAAGEISLSNGLGGVSTHATSIGGILIGNDENAFHSDFGDFKYVGAAPGATIKISEFWRFISSFTPDGKKIDTDILTMSLGVVFESWWTRRLELLAAEQGTVIVAGIGNGNDVYDPPLYPAAGGNVIAVGVIDSLTNTPLAASIGDFSLPRPAHSSYGPTPDGRCGVDIVAPGNCLVPDADSVDGYAVAGSCSSFATPVVAGTVALLTQHAKADDELAMAVSKDGGNCVIKSILLNSARKLPYWHKGAATEKDDHEFSLDFVQGAGALDAVAAFEQLTSGQQGTGIVAEMGWDSGLLAKKLDSLKYYRFEIEEPADKFITVTLTWNRHYKNEYPFAADLAADRDLRIELWGSAKGIVGSEILLDFSDTVNDNIEHIYCQTDPSYDSYEIVVMSNDGPSGVKKGDSAVSEERYAVAWSVRDKETERHIQWIDLDGNGIFEMLDLKLLMGRLNKAPDTKKGYMTGDINMDGEINTLDMMEMVKDI